MKWGNNLLLLGDMGFRPSKADPDFWMRCTKGNYYEYIFVMVDDLIIFSREPKLTIESIIYLFNYGLKGGGRETEHLLHTPLDDMPPMITPIPSIPPEPPPEGIPSGMTKVVFHNSNSSRVRL